MKKLLAALIVSTALLSPALGWDQEVMNKTIDQTNFLINDGCSGTLIDNSGYILTANHCIDQQYRIIEKEEVDENTGEVKKKKVRVASPGTAAQITYKGPHETQRAAYVFKIKSSDIKLDLAVIKTEADLSKSDPVKLACENPKRGDVAFVVGNPFGVLYSSVTKGIVSSITRSYEVIGVDDQDNNALMQISSGVIGGNSGGGVFNDNGEQTGVVVRGSRVNEIVGLAVPLSDVKQFLSRAGLEHVYKHCNKTKGE